MNISNVLDSVAKKLIDAGAPASVRFDILASHHTLKTTYCKYRRFISSDSDDTVATFHVGDVVTKPNELQVSIHCSVLPGRKREIMTVTCDMLQ